MGRGRWGAVTAGGLGEDLSGNGLRQRNGFRARSRIADRPAARAARSRAPQSSFKRTLCPRQTAGAAAPAGVRGKSGGAQLRALPNVPCSEVTTYTRGLHGTRAPRTRSLAVAN